METRRSAGGAGLAGPPRRPADPPPAEAAARWVDEQLAARGTCGPVVVDRLVAHAIATYDPETHEDRENDVQAGWDVKLTHPDPTEFLGTCHLEATGDTLVLKPSTTRSAPIAHQLFLDGDTDPLGVRKVKALGILTGQPATPARRRSRPTSGSTPATSNPTPSPLGEIEKLGAATLTKIRDWVGHHQVAIQPVLDRPPRRRRHPRPTRLDADLVHLRDGHCIFPSCQVDARSCDLDHSTPYDPDGPPGQTRPATSPASAGDTTAPRPPDAGATSARPTATTNGTAPTEPRTSSPPGTPTGRADSWTHATGLSVLRASPVDVPPACPIKTPDLPRGQPAAASGRAQMVLHAVGSARPVPS